MAIRKFTKMFVQAVLRGERGSGTWTDSETRLGLIRTPNGSTSYRLILKVGGKTKTFNPRDPQGKTLRNSAAILTLNQGRQWAREVIANATLGKAPVPEKKPESLTFRQVSEHYLQAYREHRDDHGRAHTPKAIQSEEYATGLACGVLGKLEVDRIGPPEIHSLRDSLPSAAQKRLAHGRLREGPEQPSHAGRSQQVSLIFRAANVPSIHVVRRRRTAAWRGTVHPSPPSSAWF